MPPNPVARQTWRMVGLAVVAVAIVGLIAWWQFSHVAGTGRGHDQGTATAIPPGVELGGPFTLVDSQGQTVTEQDFLGKPLLIYFGYTYCPDVCPTELGTIAAALDQLGPEGAHSQPVFVSVDPERDKPEDMGEYVEMFHPRLIGLTGSPEQVAKAAKAWRVYYAKVELTGPDDYAMDHSAYSYLMGADGKLLAVFPHQTPPAEMARVIREKLAG